MSLELVRDSKPQARSFDWILKLAALVVVIVAMAVPVTLKVYKGQCQTVFQEVTAAPTDVPSMVPSKLP